MVAIRNVDIKKLPDAKSTSRRAQLSAEGTAIVGDRVTLLRTADPPSSAPPKNEEPVKRPPAPPSTPGLSPHQPLLAEMPGPRPLADLLSEEALSKVPLGGEITEGGVHIAKREVTEDSVTWVETVQTMTSRERDVAADDKGPPWHEIVEGDLLLRQRDVPDTDGGEPWKEQVLTRGGSTESCRVRKEPSNDGGPVWTHYHSDKQDYRYRYVEPTDLGPDWMEVQEGDSIVRQRTIRSHDGRGPWNEQRMGEHYHHMQRVYTDEKGEQWQDNILGTNRWVVRRSGYEGLRQESAAKGEPTALTIRHGDAATTIQVHGAATAQEIKMLTEILQDVPPQSLEPLKTIYLSHQLGENLDQAGKSVGILTAFTGDDGDMILEREHLSTRARATAMVYHELGHVQDKKTSPQLISNSKPWGIGRSVTTYGETNGMEDLAETHRVVLENWPRYVNMSRFSWMFERAAAKKGEILQMYGVAAPRFGAISQRVQSFLYPEQKPRPTTPAPFQFQVGLDLQARIARVSREASISQFIQRAIQEKLEREAMP